MQLRSDEDAATTRAALEAEAAALRKKLRELWETNEVIASVDQELELGMELCDIVLDKPLCGLRKPVLSPPWRKRSKRAT